MKFARPAPGPRGALPGGALLALRRHPETFLRLAREYGELVEFRVGRLPVLLVSEPGLVDAVLTETTGAFVKGWGPRRGGALGRGLVGASGELHRRHRRAMTPAFAARRMADYGSAALALAASRQASWRDGAVLPLWREMKALTLAFMSRVLLGLGADAEPLLGGVSEHVAEQFVPWMMRGGRVLRALDPRRGGLRQALRRFDEAAAGWLGSADADSAAGFIGMLRGAGLGDGEIRDELLTLVVAGHETLAFSLTWVWRLLEDHPEAARALQEEVDATGDRPLAAADVAALPYTRAVFAETLRVFPPLWMLGREAVRDVEVGGLRVGKGTLVLVSPYVIHRLPGVFAEPERFRPERWLDGSAPRPSRGAYLPFGGGPRRCIGEEIAKLEGVLVLASIARRWALRPLARTWRLSPRVTLRLRGATDVRLEARGGRA